MRKTVSLVIAIFMYFAVFPHLFVEASYPDVNGYILSKNLAAVKVEYNHKSNFPNFNYRYGKGMVEGVVAHETANNSSTINGEIAYMSTHYQNAFVHAFVDNSHVIEIHSPDYGAWGAGPYANQRFVHVELVRVHSFDKFARSINNYANYIATILYNYDLPVTSAEENGKGTLWSHNAVTKFLGGTTHGDPLGYFAKWGYKWDDFVTLVTMKYKQLPPKEDTTSQLGKVLNENVNIYPNMGDTSSLTTESTSSSSTYTDTVYYIKKIGITKGQIYYLLSKQPSSVNGVVGWVKASDLSVQPYATVDKNAKRFIIKGTGSAYTKEWGGKKDIAIEKLSVYKDQSFQVQLTEKIGTTIWYRGALGGKTVWIDSKYVSAIKESSTSRLGNIQNSSVKLYKSIGDTSSTITAGSTYTNTVYYIKKQATTNGKTYYLLSTQPSSVKGVIGWVKSSDLSTLPSAVVDYKPKMFLIKGTGSAYSKEWGGKKDTLIKTLSGFKDQGFKAQVTEKIGTTIWYRGVLAGKTVWMPSSNLAAIKETSTSRLGKVRSRSTKIYQTIRDSSTSFTAGSTYTSAVFYIKKQAIAKGQTYYLLSKQTSSGVIGWVESSGLSTYSETTVDHHSKKLVVKGTGSAFSKPWGGKKDIIYKNLSTYKGKTFSVYSTEKIGNYVWYHGTLAGKKVWISKSYLK